MKQCSPIFLFFTFFLLSCIEKRPDLSLKNTGADSITFYSNKSLDYSSSLESRCEYGDKAFDLAQKSNDHSVLYKTLYVKIQNDIEANGDSIDYNFKRLKKIVLKSNKANFKAGFHSLKATSFTKKDSSYFYFQKAKNEYLLLNDSLRAGYNLLKLSEIAMEASNFNDVQEYATEASKLLKGKKNKEYISHLNNMIGLSYANVRDYDVALSYYKEALKFADTDLFRDIIKNNIAKVYQERKEYQKAINIYAEIFSSKILDSHIESKARALDNLGYTHFLNGNSNAIQFMIEAHKIKDSINDELGLIASNLNLSNYYYKTNPALSNQYAKKAFALSEKLKDVDSKLKTLELLSKTATSKLETDRLFLNYISLNDSINYEKENAKNQFAKLKYDTKESEERFLKEKASNAESKLVAERAKSRSILTFAFLIITLLLGYLFFKSIRQKHIKEKLKEIYNTETRISKKVHDELANDVYNIMNFANNQNLEVADKKESLLNALDNVYSRTRDISRENSPIDLGENYPLQLKEMLSDYQTEDLNIIIIEENTINWNLVSENKKTATFRVLQELMINMKKHSQASLTVIKFDLANKNISINYSDNGVGFSDGKTFFKNGLQNVENRISGINGTITFDKKTNKGVKVLIAFPY